MGGGPDSPNPIKPRRAVRCRARQPDLPRPHGSGAAQTAPTRSNHAVPSGVGLDSPTYLGQGKVAVYAIGRHVYAYSAEAGCWATLSVEKPLFPAMMPPPSMMPTTSGINVSPLYMNDN